MRARLTFLSLISLVALACGGSDDAGLFQGGKTDAGIGGGSSGTGGGSSGTGANAGASGSGSGGGATGGTGGGATGGSSGTGATGTGGSPSGGASGAGGASGSGGDPPSGGASGSGGAVTGGTGGGVTGGTGGGGTGGGGTGGGGTGGGGTGGTGGGTTGPNCEGKCGSSQPQSTGSGQCYCDAQCIALGDCCPNWSKACNAFVAGQVNCGNDKCNTASELCCQQYISQSDSYNPKCQSKGAQCSGPDIYCDDPSDCDSGQVCCGSLGSSGGATFVTLATCRGSGDCRSNQQRFVFCGGSNVCPTGTKCETMSFLSKYNLPQYNVCQ